MRTSNGPAAYFRGENLTNHVVSLEPLNSSEIEFIDKIKFQGIEELIDSLKMIHDFAAYHSDLSLGTTEKMALLNLKILWEGLEELSRR
ncbi:hypothetical protein GCM10009122_58680 [Fulvivirga kasyanovii]|uniref:Uncharacterized protein n=1 Tax=Fulvivirga kasyanovii TaxID=396812 RepID=A0ABW9RV83_9BACT|nr:hypothetical protein [Fulvivirga kasyanovii]MTI27961.1 hypothetical protein [Fulvivirga kasyanovii]